jgi:hypothetical protein
LIELFDKGTADGHLKRGSARKPTKNKQLAGETFFSSLRFNNLKLKVAFS